MATYNPFDAPGYDTPTRASTNQTPTGRYRNLRLRTSTLFPETTGTGIPNGTVEVGTNVDPWTEANPFPHHLGEKNPDGTNKIPKDWPSPTQTDNVGIPVTDPVRAAVLAAFAKKGITNPTDADYWVKRINETGNWNDPQHQQYWLDRMAMQYGGVGDYSESGKVGYDGNYRVEPGYGADATSSSTGGNDAFSQQIRDKILALLSGGSDVQSDPVYNQALAAFSTQQQRATDNMRNAIAERAAAEGTTGTGGYTNQLLSAEQQGGENTANFAGQLATRQLERQRDEMMNALSLGANYMSAAEQRALQLKIAEINAALQQQSITNQNNQYNQSLGWDMSKWGWLQNLTPFSVS